MPTIELSNVSKSFGDVCALTDITLSIREGELLVLVGESGSGKSTLLRLVAGLETPTVGDIYFDGVRVTDWPPHQRKINMVFQRPALYPRRTVRELLDDTNDDTIVERLGLSPLLDRSEEELSGGERQRVALARALTRPCSLVLLDEPLASLDAGFRLEARRVVADVLRREGRTTIYVTHDQDEALSLGDRVAVLAGGVIEQLDTPLRLYSEPANVRVATRLGRFPMQMLAGRLEFEQGLCLTGISNRLTIPPKLTHAWESFAGQQVLVGVRPEQVSSTTGDPEAGQLSATVTRVEWGHPNTLVSLASEEWQLLAWFPSSSSPSVGETLEVELALRREYLFEYRTGRSLSHED